MNVLAVLQARSAAWVEHTFATKNPRFSHQTAATTARCSTMALRRPETHPTLCRPKMAALHGAHKKARNQTHEATSDQTPLTCELVQRAQ